VSTLADRLRSVVEAALPRAQEDLAELVACRSVANPAIEPVEECHRSAELAAGLFTAAGVAGVEVVPAPDGSSAVVGHTPGPPGSRRAGG
jgi:acetylornithine deacetylase/succinyl-diaminopimelate desuccinylase-like protein